VCKLSWGKMVCGMFLLCAATTVTLLARTTTITLPVPKFTTLHSFDGTDGAEPGFGALVQGTDGDFYGTTSLGGANSNSEYCGTGGCGTIFKITPGGMLTTLYNFCSDYNCTDGLGPFGGLIQGTDGNFYGTTGLGGTNDAGTVFKLLSTPPLHADNLAQFQWRGRPLARGGADPGH
jgi:uncharacterized repeat protein (TIGR03803 family)